jgi:hypothetical protein
LALPLLRSEQKDVPAPDRAGFDGGSRKMSPAAAIPALSGRAGKLARPDDQCLNKTLVLAERMLRLADEGDAVRGDPGCGVLYGVLRDSAYKLKRLAEAERQAHIKKGGWKK